MVEPAVIRACPLGHEWQFGVVCAFVERFGDLLFCDEENSSAELPACFEPAAILAGLRGESHAEPVADLHARLLSLGRKTPVDSADWYRSLLQARRSLAQDGFGLDGEEAEAIEELPRDEGDYHTLPTKQKILLLKLLVDWKMSEVDELKDRVARIAPKGAAQHQHKLADSQQQQLQQQSLLGDAGLRHCGMDDDGYMYWLGEHGAKTRVYRERAHPRWASAFAKAAEARAILDEQCCSHCGSDENDESMLLCDGCPRGFHMLCLTPPLYDVPAGDWYCPECEKEQGGRGSDDSGSSMEESESEGNEVEGAEVALSSGGSSLSRLSTPSSDMKTMSRMVDVMEESSDEEEEEAEQLEEKHAELLPAGSAAHAGSPEWQVVADSADSLQAFVNGEGATATTRTARGRGLRRALVNEIIPTLRLQEETWERQKRQRAARAKRLARQLGLDSMMAVTVPAGPRVRRAKRDVSYTYDTESESESESDSESGSENELEGTRRSSRRRRGMLQASSNRLSRAERAARRAAQDEEDEKKQEDLAQSMISLDAREAAGMATAGLPDHAAGAGEPLALEDIVVRQTGQVAEAAAAADMGTDIEENHQVADTIAAVAASSSIPSTPPVEDNGSPGAPQAVAGPTQIATLSQQQQQQ